MPACIGHDLYEGCFAADVQFFVDFIIKKEKLMSEEQFNESLKNVLLLEKDSSNWPRFLRRGKQIPSTRATLAVCGSSVGFCQCYCLLCWILVKLVIL